tara:strand:+ start:567 stop:761 length:195 start_codon:yes stop_codon:yes gene_type:complete
MNHVEVVSLLKRKDGEGTQREIEPQVLRKETEQESGGRKSQETVCGAVLRDTFTGEQVRPILCS